MLSQAEHVARVLGEEASVRQVLPSPSSSFPSIQKII